MSAQKLAKAVGDYLGSQTITNTIQEILEKKSTLGENNIKQLPLGLQIRVQTAWNWLKKLGFYYHTVLKNIYIDCHKRKNVVEYCQHEFLST